MSKVLRQSPEHPFPSVARACRKYERALIHGDMPRRADGDVRTQFERFRLKAERDEALLALVRNVLCSEGIQSCRFVPYYSFALHVAKLVRTDLGQDLDGYVRVALGHWVGRGQSGLVLERICREVFNLSVGTKPIDGCDKGGVESNGAGSGP